MFAGQGCGLFRSGNGGGPMFDAYDKKTGDVVHEMTLPGGTCGNPMTYSIAGQTVHRGVGGISDGARRADCDGAPLVVSRWSLVSIVGRSRGGRRDFGRLFFIR
jgi:hypothetical protein